MCIGANTRPRDMPGVLLPRPRPLLPCPLPIVAAVVVVVVIVTVARVISQKVVFISE